MSYLQCQYLNNHWKRDCKLTRNIPSCSTLKICSLLSCKTSSMWFLFEESIGAKIVNDEGMGGSLWNKSKQLH